MAATPAFRNHHAKQRQSYPLPTDPSKHVRRRFTASICTAASQPLPALPLPRLRAPPPAPSSGLTASVRTVAALHPAFGQLRRHPAGAPPACTLPRTRGAACRAPLRHAAPTPLGRAMAPQQRPPASGHLPHGASSSHTPAAAYDRVHRPLAQGGTKRPPRSPSEMGAAGPLPLADSAHLLLHHVTGTPCEPNFFLAKRS